MSKLLSIQYLVLFFAQVKRHLILIGLPDAWKLQEPFMILVGGKSDSRCYQIFYLILCTIGKCELSEFHKEVS